MLCAFASPMPVPDDPIGLHRAGATVRHWSPFSTLEVPVSDEPLSPVVVREWVQPLYMARFDGPSDGLVALICERWDLIDEPLALRLLSEFDWRPRSVGAYFVALKRMETHSDLIGRLLLRSDVAQAGAVYALALARLNTPDGADYLVRYLGYYLDQPDLWFDQAEALAALRYLD